MPIILVDFCILNLVIISFFAIECFTKVKYVKISSLLTGGQPPLCV